MMRPAPGPVVPACTVRHEVTSLGSDPRHEEREVAGDATDGGHVLGGCRADDQPAVATLRPLAGHHQRDPLIEREAADVEVLQVEAPGVAGPAQCEDAAALEEGDGGVRAEIWVHRDGVGGVPVERFTGVVLGRRADVATLGVQHEHDVWMAFADVGADRFERRLRPLCGEVGDLRLERADEIRGCIDDGGAEPDDGVASAGEWLGERRGIRIEPHAEHRTR